MKYIQFLRIAGIAVVVAWTQHAGADNLPDPTRPAGMSAAAVRQSGGAALQTTIVSPGRSLAVINGRTVSVGDRIGDATIVEIRPYEVVLRSRTGIKVMRMVPPLVRSLTQAASETPIEQ